MSSETDAEPSTTLMLRETAEAPAVVARLIEANEKTCADLADRLKANPPRFAVTCARGSSDSAAAYAKYLLELHLDTVVASVGPSVTSIYGKQPRMAGALFIAVSQSGRSPDLLTLAEAARAEQAITVAVVNDTESPLADLCEVVLPLHAGPERSVAATKTYVASLAALLQLAAHWSGDTALMSAVHRLADDLNDALACDWREPLPLLADVDSLYVAGRAPGFAVAQEAALKMKETCGLHAEAMSAAEMQHGPLALAGPRFPVIMFSQRDEALPSLTDIGRQLVDRDVPVLTAGPAEIPGAISLPAVTAIHPFAQPLALIQSFYPLAEVLSRTRGRDPDRPPNLKKVTETL
ncbi:SIS domain-containing protein [Bauldia sp.]|uniref:SIS domain-containing protein n=1 Tax=Bauldia sp. TaxID=2575872 RepID=UPI003BACF2C1